jgi:hypothetical protein
MSTLALAPPRTALITLNGQDEWAGARRLRLIRATTVYVGGCRYLSPIAGGQEARQPVPLAAVPTLADVARDPARLATLPLDVLIDLQRQVGHLSADVGAAITRQMARPHGGAVAPVRAVRIDEAAKVLAMSEDFLYRNWSKLGGYKDDDGHLKFPDSTLRRHVTRKGR